MTGITIVSCICLGVWLVATVYWGVTYFQTENIRRQTLLKQLLKLDDPEPTFKLSEYYERMIALSEDIAREKASQKTEPTVLWLTLEGLCINEDGTCKWIQKKAGKA